MHIKTIWKIPLKDFALVPLCLKTKTKHAKLLTGNAPNSLLI